MSPVNQRVLLARYPVGPVHVSDFAFDERPVPVLQPGEVLLRNVYLSCDPYLRGRMVPGGFALGEPVVARAVSVIVKSAHGGFRPGEVVWGFLPWERFSVVPGGGGLTAIDPALGPIRYAISVLGMPGLTAHVGVFDIGRPVPGETVLVSSASGAVGSVAGQLARLAGARVVGSAGGERKVAHVVERLRFHDCFDYRAELAAGRTLDDALARHCPEGIDVYFDNVGGPLLEAVLRRMNPHARIAVCGMISNLSRPAGSGEPSVQSLNRLVGARATMTGFTIYDHLDQLPGYVRRMSELLRRGEVVFDDDVVVGIENTPAAFIGMLEGDNLGKRLVQVSDDPTGG